MVLLLAILKAVLGVFILMAVWFGVQQYIRKRTRLGPELDVLEDMTHGCGCCHNSEFCSGEIKEEPHGCGAPPRAKHELIEIVPAASKEQHETERI